MRRLFSLPVIAAVLLALASCMSDNYILKDAKPLNKEPIYIDTVKVYVGAGNVEGVDFTKYPAAIMNSVNWKEIASLFEGHGFRIVYNSAALTNVKEDYSEMNSDYTYTVSDGLRGYRFALGGDMINRAHTAFGGIGLSVIINSDPDGIVASSTYFFSAMNTNMADTVIINNTGDLFEDAKVKNLADIITLINKTLPARIAEDVKKSEEQ